MRLLVGVGLASGTFGAATAQSAAEVTFRRSHLVVKTKSGAYPFNVEIAENDAQRAQGLMFRQTLAVDDGMLFDFKSERYISMWMRNTMIPLDMLFLDNSGRITFIRENTVPYSRQTIEPPDRNRAVLELAGGTVTRLGFKVGDVVEHPIFK